MDKKNKTIFTFNNLDNIIFTLYKDYFKLSDETVNRIIWEEYDLMRKRLLMKGIDYNDLKGALIPNQEKGKSEICLVIDNTLVPESCYGRYVFYKMMPFIDKESTYSILHGDYLIGLQNYKDANYQKMMKDALEEKLCISNISTYKDCAQYYLIYFNRITKKQLETLVNGLKNNKWFIGYVDVSYDSLFKKIISRRLVHFVIKCKGIFLGSHPECYDDYENVNISGYRFEEYGFDYVSINETSYMPFLSYKIDMGGGNKEDVSFSLNALFPKFDSIDKLYLFVRLDKWEKYLVNKSTGKGEIIEKIGFSDDSKADFEKTIYNKICSRYIYNIRHNEFGDFLFNVCIELDTINGNKRKTMVALKYHPDNGNMEMVTLT